MFYHLSDHKIIYWIIVLIHTRNLLLYVHRIS